MQANFLSFALPDLDGTELEQLKAALDSGWITTGPKTGQFEQAFAQYVGAAHAIAVNSCTAAMHLALEAIGLRRGDLVLTTPYTFAATAEVIRYFDATPIFVDIEPKTLNIDPAKLAEVADALDGAAPPRTFLPPALRDSVGNGQSPGPLKAIMPVHMAGYPCELDAIYALAARHNLPVIEDAAHALGSKYKSCPIGWSRNGLLPSVVCFSFYATKSLTTGEGGMICTGHEEIADRCRKMSLHGISKDAWKRYTAEGTWYYEILAPGYKYNMTDLAAALGLAQLAKVERMRRRRCEIAKRYNEAFCEMPELQPPADCVGSQHAWHLYTLRLNLERLAIDRARFIAELKHRKIGTSVHFIPLHIHPYYRQEYGYKPDDFPVAYAEYQREISLPIYSKMSEADVLTVVHAVKDVVARHRR